MAKRRKKVSQRKVFQELLAIGASVTLDITDINHEGQGIGHYEGLTVFVPQTIPGDTVNIVIVKRLSRYAVGRATEMLKSSPVRIEPDCPQAHECGGCSLQMMQYPAQLCYKQRQVVDALQRIGKITDISGIVNLVAGMENNWNYRSKVQFPVSGSWEQPQIGFYASRSHAVVDAPVCRIQPSVCDVIKERVRRHIHQWQIDPYREEDQHGLIRHLVIRTGFATGDVMIIMVINGEILPGQTELIDALKKCIADHHESNLPPMRLRGFFINIQREKTNVILSSDCRLEYGSPYIEEAILGLQYRISPMAFFQVNPRQTEVLFQIILDMAKLSGVEQVLDLYCGTGSITLQLAQNAGWVLGIESHPDAINDALVNAEINGITNVQFVNGKTEEVLPEWLDQGISIDLTVIDPPRKGCEPAVITALGQLLPPRIIYVSCNPATLARDLLQLKKFAYQVMIVQPVDLFPWTGHVETVVLMTRSEAGKV